MNETPFVTVIMPIRNEADFIAESLGRVLEQDYPLECLEVLVADGMSTDDTRAIVLSFQNEYPQVHLVDNPRLTAPAGLNTAIPLAKGDVIVRVDGHALIDRDYIRQCVTWLQQSGVDCVGGAMDSVGQGYVGETIALAMSSPFGVGGSGFRVAGASQEPVLTDTIPFGAYRREVFTRIGLFNEAMIRHQDYEFCYRLRRAGGKILLLPFVRARYFVRSRLDQLWRQYWQYGLWKGRFVRAHPDSLRPRHMIPPLFILALFSTVLLAVICSPAQWLLFLVVGSYLAFILLASLRLSTQSHIKYLLFLPIVFVTLHLSWGTGVWIGLISGMKTRGPLP